MSLPVKRDPIDLSAGHDDEDDHAAASAHICHDCHKPAPPTKSAHTLSPARFTVGASRDARSETAPSASNDAVVRARRCTDVAPTAQRTVDLRARSAASPAKS